VELYDLEFPRALSPVAGEIPVQIQRTVRAGMYRDGTPSPQAEHFDIAGGEFSILAQYQQAIAAARSTIYVEDQAIGSAEIIAALDQALRRGVEVVFLVPGQPPKEFIAALANPAHAEFARGLAALREHANFALVAIAVNEAPTVYRDVYVHAKIALIDDAFCTIGSCNVATRSFYGDTELNASFWHAPTVRALRCELLREHIGRDTSGIGDREALGLYAEIARANTLRRARGEATEGLAFALDPATYGR
jgi:phosphatidylserine/phosphatidylglycerophosphate/cardiolipin synthase-like enzyme